MTERLTDERLAELRKVAEGAELQEPWRTDDDEGRMVFAASGHQVYSALYGSNNGDAEPGDAEHIAAFDPPTVLALLDRITELQRRLDAVEALHMWHDCPDPGCNFASACNACNHPYPCPTVKAARGETA